MNYCVYILYSSKTEGYYIGETHEITQRMNFHNDASINSNSTKRGIPWELYFQIPVKNRIQARKIESHIKRMKSKVYIENLKKYSGMSEKLKEKYKG